MLFHSLQGSLFHVRLATENTRSSIILLRGEERGNGEISSGNRKARRKGNGEEELIGEGKQRGKRGVEKGPLEVTPTENSPILP